MKSTAMRPVTLAIVLFIVLLTSAGCAQKATPAPATVAPAPATAAVSTETPETAEQLAGVSVDGLWEGMVEVAGQGLVTRVNFKTDAGQLKGTVDFPQQNAVSLPLEKVSHEGTRIHFEVLAAPRTAVFDGELKDADNIAGDFEQSGYKGTFKLERQKAKTEEAPPYTSEEVTFKNGDITLAGTLTLPAGAGSHPAVVLISGSGAQNRDEEIFGFPIFRTLADHLSRQGIAVLRYDDRGLGGSTAGSDEDTSETYAGDVAAAVQYLKGRSEIDPRKIGLLGHSEGGIIAPMVATRSSDVAFIILMSAPGLPGRQILEEQTRLILKAAGSTDEQIEKQASLQKRAIDAALTGQGWDEVKAEMRAEYEAALAAMTESQRKTIPDQKKWVEDNVQAQADAMERPWMKYFLTYDPAPTLEKVSVPVLALFGGLDTQVAAEPNRAAVTAALERGGNKDYTVKVFPDANHLYQSARTGSPGEYASLKAEFTAGFLETISDWILEHTK